MDYDLAYQRLAEFDLDHLKKMYVILFDIWCWEDSSPTMKNMLDAIVARISEMEGGAPIQINNPPHVRLSDNDQTLLINRWGIDYEFINFSNGSPEFGKDGERWIKQLLERELFGNHYSGGGSMLEQSLQSFITNHNLNDWGIREMTRRIEILEKKLSEEE